MSSEMNGLLFGELLLNAREVLLNASEVNELLLNASDAFHCCSSFSS
jgi:hypothetical protein